MLRRHFLNNFSLGASSLMIPNLAKEFISDVDLNYTKHYIGFKVKNRANNFSLSRPQKGGVKLSIRLPKSEETNEKISSAELDILNYFRGMYQIRLTEKELKDNRLIISELMKEAYWDTDLLNDLSQTMADASICGLGQAASNPLKSVLKYFPNEVKDGGKT